MKLSQKFQIKSSHQKQKCTTRSNFTYLKHNSIKKQNFTRSLTKITQTSFLLQNNNSKNYFKQQEFNFQQRYNFNAKIHYFNFQQKGSNFHQKLKVHNEKKYHSTQKSHNLNQKLNSNNISSSKSNSLKEFNTCDYFKYKDLFVSTTSIFKSTFPSKLKNIRCMCYVDEFLGKNYKEELKDPEPHSEDAFVENYFPNSEEYTRVLLQVEIDSIISKFFPEENTTSIIEKKGIEELIKHIENLNSIEASRLRILGRFWGINPENPQKDHEVLILESIEVFQKAYKRSGNTDWKSLLCLGLIYPRIAGEILEALEYTQKKPENLNEFIWSLECIAEMILKVTSREELYNQDDIPVFFKYLHQIIEYPFWNLPRNEEIIQKLEDFRLILGFGPSNDKNSPFEDWCDPHFSSLLINCPTEMMEKIDQEKILEIRRTLIRNGMEIPPNLWPLVITLSIMNYRLGFPWCESKGEYQFIGNQVIQLTQQTEWNDLFAEKLALLCMYNDLKYLITLIKPKIPNIVQLLEDHSFLNELLRLEVITVKEREDLEDSIESWGVNISKNDKPNYDFFSKNISPKYYKVNISSSSLAQSIFEDCEQNSDAEEIDVLELGCGTGLNSFFHNFPETVKYSNGLKSYLAVDYSKSRLAYAKWIKGELEDFRIGDEERSPINIDFVHANIYDLTPQFLKEKRPNGPNKFDVIIANDVLHYTPDISKGFQLLSDLIKDNGVVQLGVYSGPGLDRIKSFQIFMSNKLLKINPKPLFWYSEDKKQTKLLRYPTSYELRLCRSYLLEEFSQTEPNLFFRVTPLDNFLELCFRPYAGYIPTWSQLHNEMEKTGFGLLKILPSCDKDSSMIFGNIAPLTFHQKMEKFESEEQFEQFLEDSGEREHRTGLYKIHMLKGKVELGIPGLSEDSYIQQHQEFK